MSQGSYRYRIVRLCSPYARTHNKLNRTGTAQALVPIQYHSWSGVTHGLDSCESRTRDCFLRESGGWLVRGIASVAAAGDGGTTCC